MAIFKEIVPLLLYLCWFLCSASLAEASAGNSLQLLSYNAKRGIMSDQGVQALQTLDQTDRDDDWDKYVEISSGTSSSSLAVFVFRIDTSSNLTVDEITELTIVANTNGLERDQQRRVFEIRNATSGDWEIIGDNKRATSWVWCEDTFQVQSDRGFSDFFEATGKIRIRIRVKNDADVTNVDYLAITAIGTPTNAPTMSPTASPSMLPTEFTAEHVSWWVPKASEQWTWQLQLSGTVDTSVDVDMYNVNLFDTSVETIETLKDDGRIVVCYFSAGTYESWIYDWVDHFSFLTVGEMYNGYERPFGGYVASGLEERWLDIREFDLLEGIMRGRFELAIEKGCDAVEAGNVDGYSKPTETLLELTYDDQLTYNRWLARMAHEYGLSIGLKNDLEQLEDLVDYFDWAVNERCIEYGECGGYANTFLLHDKAVFGVAYSGEPSVFCLEANEMGMSWILKSLSLKVYREGCEDYRDDLTDV